MKYLKYTGFGILGLGFIALVIWLIMTLWNWLVPDLFHGPEINYWQTIGLFFLSKILFAGIAPGRSHTYKKDDKWKKKFTEKYHQKKSMTSEENL